MPWRLVPLHAPGDPAVPLPREGAASVGRRPTNHVVCRDLAVSGQHCTLHCRKGGLSEPPELEDCSTNGTYINEAKLSKGQRQRLTDGDVISLTKQPEEELGQDLPPRVQFKLEFRDADVPEATAIEASMPDRPVSQRDRPQAPVATALAGVEQAPAELGSAAGVRVTEPLAGAGAATAGGDGAWGGAEHNFAQDLLVQEQQSKAKITSELLIAQRKLEEERLSAESLNRELRKVRQQVEEERARRHEAEEARDRLNSEAELLRTERRQLKELTVTHDELRTRQDAAEAELQGRLHRCQQMEAAQEQLRHELERVTEANQKASQQHAEISTRARQAQERAERLEQQHAEAQRDADRALEEGARLQRELAAEVGAKQQLEEQVNECKELLVKAEASERSAREALDSATARRAELECQASSAQSDAEAARAAARQAQQRLASTLRHAERLREAGQGLSSELRRRAGLWERALADGCLEGLGDALAGQEVSTFEAVTCRNDAGETPTRSQHAGDSQPAAAAAEAAAAPPPGLAPGSKAAATIPAPAAADAAVQGPLAASAHSAPAAHPVPSAGAAVQEAFALEPAATAVCLEEEDSPSPRGRGPAAGTLRCLDDDGLLEAVARQPLADAPGGAGLPAAADGAGGAARAAAAATVAAAGCSTAWSLELLEVVEPRLNSGAPGAALDERLPKRPRLADV